MSTDNNENDETEVGVAKAVNQDASSAESAGGAGKPPHDAPPNDSPSGGDEPPQELGVSPINIEDEMSRSYLDYAMSVIVSRAIPDVREDMTQLILQVKQLRILLHDVESAR